MSDTPISNEDNAVERVTSAVDFVMTEEAVQLSLHRDNEYADTHSLIEKDWALPSGKHKLDYIVFHGDPYMGQFRCLAHLATGEYVAPERVYKDYTNLTWRIREATHVPRYAAMSANPTGDSISPTK